MAVLDRDVMQDGLEYDGVVLNTVWENLTCDGESVYFADAPDAGKHDVDELRAAVDAIVAGAEKVELSDGDTVEVNARTERRLAVKVSFGSRYRITCLRRRDDEATLYDLLDVMG